MPEQPIDQNDPRFDGPKPNGYLVDEMAMYADPYAPHSGFTPLSDEDLKLLEVNPFRTLRNPRFVTLEEEKRLREETESKAVLVNKFAEVLHHPSAEAKKPVKKESRKHRRYHAAIAKKLNDKVSELAGRYFSDVDVFARTETRLTQLDQEYKRWLRLREKDYEYSAFAHLFLTRIVEISKTRAGLK